MDVWLNLQASVRDDLCDKVVELLRETQTELSQAAITMQPIVIAGPEPSALQSSLLTPADY
jgi:hypothetical protein